MRVEEGCVVTLSYKLMTRSASGEVALLEERTPEYPFEFIYGKGQTLPAIEAVIRGKTSGFQTSIGVDPAQAYGEFDNELVAEVQLEQFANTAAGADVQVGMQFSTRGPEGEEITVRVIEVRSEEGLAVVDGNHPLAGLALDIDLHILDVRAAGDSGSDSSPDDSSDGSFDDSSGGPTTDEDGNPVLH